MRAGPPRLVQDGLLATADRCPEAIALVAEGRCYRYGELADAASRLARALQEHGLTRGERVAVYMDNGWPAVVSVFGTLLAGGVLMVVNPQTREDKLAYILQDSGASVLLADGQLARWFVGAAGSSAQLRTVICTGPLPASLPQALAFEEVLEGYAPAHQDPGTIPLDLAALIYTSGSTGRPKGVMMSHQNMVFAMGSVTEYLELTADDRILNVLPLAFSYGLYQLLMAAALGAMLVLERSFSYPSSVLERMRQEEITVFPGVPTIFASILALDQREPLSLPSVTTLTNAAAALPVGFLPGLQRIFPHARIFKMYGLTECKRVSYLQPELALAKPASVGKAIPGTEVFLLSETGEPVPPGGTGILHVRGPHVMQGYWNQPELSARMLVPGRYPGERVLCTHDVFRMDEEGFLYFVGRSDDIIKTRGEKVAPGEVEDVLYAIPGIREAAVVGVPDELLGEAVRAFVVLDEGARLSEAEVRRACVTRLESVKVPRDVLFVAELPKTATGKIRKKSLRELQV